MVSQLIDAFTLDGIRRPVRLDRENDRCWTARPLSDRVFAIVAEQLLNPAPSPSKADQAFLETLHSVPGRIAREVCYSEHIAWREYEDDSPGRCFQKSMPLRLYRSADGMYLVEIRIGQHVTTRPKTYFRVITPEQASIWLTSEGFDADKELAEAEPPSAPEPPPTPATVERKHTRKNGALVMLSAGLDRLIEIGKFGLTDSEIMKECQISRERFYHYIDDDKGDDGIKRKMRRYRAGSIGRGPTKAGRL